MAVYLFFEKRIPFRENKRNVAKWIRSTVEKEGKKCGSVNIITVDEEEIKKLNRWYLKREESTDVISFPLGCGKKVEGDIYISMDNVKENAIHWRVSEKEEWRRVVIHGVLHLIGYLDDSSEERRIMKEKEDYYLQRFPE